MGQGLKGCTDGKRRLAGFREIMLNMADLKTVTGNVLGLERGGRGREVGG